MMSCGFVKQDLNSSLKKTPVAKIHFWQPEFFYFFQSSSSRWNISSVFLPKMLAILRASTVDGIYLHCYIAFIVWRLTCTSSASCCWVMRLMALSTLMSLVIAAVFSKAVNQPVVFRYEQDHEAEHVYAHECKVG